MFVSFGAADARDEAPTIAAIESTATSSRLVSQRFFIRVPPRVAWLPGGLPLGRFCTDPRLVYESRFSGAQVTTARSVTTTAA